MGTARFRYEDDGQLDASVDQEQVGTELGRMPQSPLELPNFGSIVVPQLAFRSDSVVLLSIEDLTNYDLTGRRRWTGIELTPDEVEEVRRRFLGAAEEAAAHVAGRFMKKKDRDS